MERRRALLSVLPSSGGSDGGDTLPPESTTFAFPLYLNTTMDLGDGTYGRDADDISMAFFEWCENNQEDGKVEEEVAINITDDTPIYINGLRVVSAHIRFSIVEFLFDEQNLYAELLNFGDLYFYV